MVAEFNTWKATAGLSAAELTEREVELNKLFTACRSTALGRAVQVDPMKPKLKPPGTKHLKLKRDRSVGRCRLTL
jgi:hypothetical protein